VPANRADRITLKIDAEVTEAVIKIKKVQDAYIQFTHKAKEDTIAAAAAVNKFSGIPIIREALAAGRAIERLGGVAKLTAKEQEALNKTVTEAIAKYKALGGEVPAILQKIADQTKKIDDQTRLVQASMAKLGGNELLAQANAVVTAVNNIGGATKLTGKEQETVNKLLTEALNKYKVLGQTAPAEMKKLAAETKKVDDQTKAVQMTLEKFSGRTMLQEANNAVAAIQKLGGATKLTAKEKQALNIQLTEAINKYKALGQSAPAEMNKLWSATKQLGEETKRGGDLWNRAWFRLTGSITAADFAAKAIAKTFEIMWGAAKKIASELAEIVIEGSKVQNITAGFTSLLGGVEKSAKVLDSFRTSTRGLVTDLDLMQAANRAALFGLKVSAEDVAILGDAAVKLGRAMGIDTAKGLDDLVLALGRVSPRILDNLGIIVKVGEANQKWIDTNGGTVRSMTAQNRVAAFSQEALRQIAKHVATLGDVNLTLADRLTIVNVKWENFRNQLGLAINQSPVFKKALDFVSDAMTKAFSENREETIQKIVNLLEDMAIAAIQLAQAFVDLGKFAVDAGVEVLKSWNEVAFILSKIVELSLRAEVAYLKFLERTRIGSGARNQLQDQRIDAELRLHDQELLVASNRRALDSSLALARGEGVITEAYYKTKGTLAELLKVVTKARAENTNYAAAVQGVSASLGGMAAAAEDVAKAEDAGKKDRDDLIKDMAALNAALVSAQEHHTDVNVVLKEYGAKLTDVSNRSKVWGIAMTEAIEKWVHLLETSQPQRDKFIKEMGDLEMLLQALPKDMAFEDVMELLGAQLERVTNKARAAKIPIPPLVAAWAQMKDAAAETQLEIKKLAENLEAALTAHEAWSKKLDDMRDKAIMDRAKVGKRDPESREDINAERLRQEMKDLGAMPTEGIGDMTQWMETASAIGARFTAEAEDIKLTWTKTFEEMGKDLPNVLVKAFSGENPGAAIGTFISQSIAPNLVGPQSKLGGLIASGLTGTKDAATGVVSGGLANAGGIMGMVGKGLASMIPFIGPAIGMLAGPMMKGIKRLFGGPSMESKVAADLGKKYGQDFSKELNEAIAKDATRLGDRMAATSLHLKKLIDEAGGVTMSNVKKWTGEARDIFVFLERGIIDSEEAAKSLNEVIPELAETFEDAGGIWNAEFQELISLAQDSQVEIEAVQKLMDEQLEKMSGGTGKATKGFTDPLLKLAEAADVAKKELEDAKKELDSFDKTDSKDKDKVAAAQDKVTQATKNAAKAQDDLQKATVGSQEEFDRLSRISLRTFNTLVAEGKSPIEAMDAIGEGFDELVKTADKLGLSGSAAFQELKRFRELTEANRPLIESIGGINDVLIASINLKTLDQEAFADLEAQGLSSYQKLIAAGFTEKEALGQIAPLLGSIIEAHEQRGVAIDDETAKLIAAADEEGLLKEKQISTNQILMEGLTAIIDAVGGKVPEAWRKAAEAAEAANRRSEKATDGTGDAVDEVVDDLEAQKRKWAEVARAAEEANSRIEDSVDGVTEGHSPGGLKEWSPMLEKSRRAMHRFAQDGTRDMEALQRTLLKTGGMAVSPTHNGAVMAHYDRATSRAPGPTRGGVVVQGDVKISTWTVNDQRDLIRKTITPEVLKTVHDGGEPGRNFTKLVRGGTKK
jgi:hypothetical protein